MEEAPNLSTLAEKTRGKDDAPRVRSMGVSKDTEDSGEKEEPDAPNPGPRCSP